MAESVLNLSSLRLQKVGIGVVPSCRTSTGDAGQLVGCNPTEEPLQKI